MKLFAPSTGAFGLVVLGVETAGVFASGLAGFCASAAEPASARNAPAMIIVRIFFSWKVEVFLNSACKRKFLGQTKSVSEANLC